MIWGGSALPLVYARVPHVTRFVLPRFAVAPYATELTRGAFHQELAADPPALILDLHERGDNQFDNPIESEPFVARLVREKYRLYISESIPWAKFYFLEPPAAAAGLVAVAPAQPVLENPRALELYQPFPIRRESWERLGELARKGGISRAIGVDWMLRAQASLELLERQSSSADMRVHSGLLARALEFQLQSDSPVPPGLRSDVLRILAREAAASDGVYPLPMLSPSWWATVAMVELQPRAPQEAIR